MLLAEQHVLLIATAVEFQSSFGADLDLLLLAV